jgi:hypothetical protein
MLVDLIVSLIVIGVVVLMGVLGYFIDKTAEPVEHKRQGKGA